MALEMAAAFLGPETNLDSLFFWEEIKGIRVTFEFGSMSPVATK
jgi:hypothetical protein